MNTNVRASTPEASTRAGTQKTMGAVGTSMSERIMRGTLDQTDLAGMASPGIMGDGIRKMRFMDEMGIIVNL